MMSNICLMDPGDFLVQMDQSDFNGFSSVSSFFWPPDLGYNPDWCSAGISTKRFCISSSAKRWSVSDLSADLCDLCDLRFSSHVIPCHPSPPPQVEEAHSASWHKCSCPESRGTRGNQRNQWEWHVRHRTAPSEKTRFKPFKQASETVPKIRTWLHTAVQSGCSFIASSVELKHEETADLPLFNNTFHLNPNCWSTQHATNSTSSDAFRFAHLRQHSVGELFSDWLTESFSKHPTVSRSDQLLLDRPRPWDLSDLSAVPSSIPKYQNTKVKTDQKNFW